LNDPEADGLLIIHSPQGNTESVETARLIAETSTQAKKTILTSVIGEDDNCREARRILRGEGIPAFSTPEEAVSAFMYMYSYTRNLELLYQTPEELTLELPDQNALKGILRHAFCEGRQILSLSESMLFLDAYKIPIAKTIVAKTPEEAIKVSTEIGFPTVLKALSHQFTHKSEIGGVILNVCSPAAVTEAFEKLEKRVLSSQSSADFLGVAVQPMIQSTQFELLVGSKRDPQFGSIVIFGAGGTSAELLKDTSVGFPPLNQILSRRLMEDAAIYGSATRSGHSRHVELVEEILVKFSQLVIDFPEISEIDVNPLIVTEKSVVAVDARMVIDRERIMREVAEHRDHLVVAPYPKKFSAVRELKNKVMVLLRPIKPEDEERFNDLFRSLSEETKRLRFFEIIKELSHDTLTRYCNLDYYREMAIVAEIQDGSRKIIGVARLIVEPNERNGEFAILVGDSWQSLNVGSKLMDQIIDVAKDMHLENVYGFTVPDNYRMIGLSVKKGFETKTLDEYTVKMSLTIPH
jgi:acetyltransferase